MRPRVRGVAAISLAVWLLCGGLAHLVSLHVEIEHLVLGHHDAHAGESEWHHSDGHVHQLVDASATATRSGPRAMLAAPSRAMVRAPWSTLFADVFQTPAPDPHPRGRPLALEHSAILLI